MARKRYSRRSPSGLLRFAWLLGVGSVVFGGVYLLWNEESILRELRSIRPNVRIDLKKSETPNLRKVLEDLEANGGGSRVLLSPLQEGEGVEDLQDVSVGDLVTSPLEDEEALGIGDVEYWRQMIRDVREGFFGSLGEGVDSFLDLANDLSVRGVLDLIFSPDPLSVGDEGAIMPLQNTGSGEEILPLQDGGVITVEEREGETRTFVGDVNRLTSLGEAPSIPDEEIFSRTVEEIVDSLREPGKGVDVYAGLLHPNPDPKLLELTPDGVLPRIDNAGRPSWQVYKRPHLTGSNLPQVFVVVSNLGLNDFQTARSIHLPGAVTLAFAPYARRLSDWVNAARGEGHEVMLTLPMEPKRYPHSDPGPFGLLTSLDKEENIKRLHHVLSRTTGYVGVMNFLGDKFVLDAAAVEPVMQSLNARGLFFLDTHPERLSLASLSATVLNMPHASVDIVLDQSLSRDQVVKRMRDSSRLARARGGSVMVVYPLPYILDELEVWFATLAESEIELAPLTSRFTEEG